MSRYRIKHGIAWGDDLTTTLEEAIKHINEDGYEVVNIDMTVVCQEPRISSIREQLEGKVASFIDTDKERVSVKGASGNRPTTGFLVLGIGLLQKAAVCDRKWENSSRKLQS